MMIIKSMGSWTDAINVYVTVVVLSQDRRDADGFLQSSWLPLLSDECKYAISCESYG